MWVIRLEIRHCTVTGIRGNVYLNQVIGFAIFYELYLSEPCTLDFTYNDKWSYLAFCFVFRQKLFVSSFFSRLERNTTFHLKRIHFTLLASSGRTILIVQSCKLQLITQSISSSVKQHVIQALLHLTNSNYTLSKCVSAIRTAPTKRNTTQKK